MTAPAASAYPQVGLNLLNQLDHLDGWTIPNVRQNIEAAEDRLAAARHRHREQQAYRAELLEALVALGLARKEGSEIIVTRPEQSAS